MKYTVSIGRWGAECHAGKISDDIWKYIQEECDGDSNEYAEKLDSGEVPDEYKLAEDSASFYDAGSFFDKWAAYADTDIQIYDENNNEVLNCCLKDLKQEIWNETKEPDNCKHCFVWTSGEKSEWMNVEITTDEPFNKDKLKVNVDRLNLYNEDYKLDFVSGIEYDGQIFEAESPEYTRGISCELEFIDDGIPE